MHGPGRGCLIRMNEIPESVICGQRFKVGIIVGKEPVFLVQLDGFLQVIQSIVGVTHGKLRCCHGVIDVIVVLFGEFQSPGIVAQGFVVLAVIVVKDGLVENFFRRRLQAPFSGLTDACRKFSKTD